MSGDRRGIIGIAPGGLSRRQALAGIAGTVGAVACPAISYGQADAIRIGHLTPVTGFLGPLGEYAQMGVRLAADEINANGGVMGRKIELVMEDSVNPQTGSAKAERLIERDKVAMIIGEISSATALGIGQIAARTKTVFINTGANSDAIRGKDCNPFMFHIEAANSMMVQTVGNYLKAANMISGKKWYMLTADYAFGHDLLKVAKKYVTANGAQMAGEDLVPTDSADFSPYLLKIRQARPDIVASNLAGNQITNFIKQYAEYGLQMPITGFGFDTAVAWGAGQGNFAGIWPLIWHHLVDNPSSKKFVEGFSKKYGRLPENQAWGDYNSLKLVAQSFAELKSTDPVKLQEHLRKGAKFDILKGREGYFRAYDNQMIQEMYAVKAKDASKMKDKWDIYEPLGVVPAAGTDLEVLAPEKDGTCKMPA
ncbi:ABC transporter substrate-binding protein [Enterovirga rhinocerotis]|uniref:Amino acid/amide ABC transporter substrate-binding protein (HAAT family) n=1 Tax=Enterovirga rhinocerotis TaxID=1339210 RepID=A0A4R7C7J7_9HYPH|nr:ABC transporter substrate-binding protein [Enterovirga rhinocerotis]TDR93952.1 amino acid/amide ABC transporter substrate-binding protein (HAAT family) [Enterovirga rhinocerotis]